MQKYTDYDVVKACRTGNIIRLREIVTTDYGKDLLNAQDRTVSTFCLISLLKI